MTNFIEFPKMSRLSREVIVTEKIDGTKKSAKGLLMVQEIMSPDSLGKLHHVTYQLKDQCTEEEEKSGALETVFEDGKLVKEVTLDEIKKRLTL